MTVTPDDVVGRAHAMIPMLRERAAEDARNRNVRPETVAEMQDAGFWRVLAPKRWGGFEMSPDVAAEILMALGRGDLSVAWICGIYMGHAYHLAHFDPRAQEDVWSNPDARIVSPYAPLGKATPVAGGFRLSGRWAYSSGSMHSNWAFLGGISTEDPRDYRIFLLPRKDYEILDTWSVVGLEATGSHDLVVKDAFIPEHRTQKANEVFGMDSAGLKLNTNPIYRIPFYQVASRNLSTGQIGALESMLEIYREQSAKRINAMGSRVALDPDAQYAAAQAFSAIEDMKGTLHRNNAVLMEHAYAGKLPPIEQRLLYRYQSAEVAERCVRLAMDLFQAAGGSALYHRTPYAMIYRNLLAARAHIGNSYRELGRRFGSVLLGGEHAANDFAL